MIPVSRRLFIGGTLAALTAGSMAGRALADTGPALRIGTKLDGVITWRYAFNAGAPVLPGFARRAEFSL